MIDDATH